MARNPEEWIPTRRSLLIRLKDWEDQEGWKDFFDTYWRLIYGVAMKAGLTDSEAQETVQETMIVVARKMPGFEYDPQIGSFKGWLLHTVRWKIQDQLRRRAHRLNPFGRRRGTSTRTPTLERIPDPAGSVLEGMWHQEWEQNLLEVAIERVKGQVKARHYQIFDLYVIKQWPVEKVARTLGVNVGLVYLAKHRISALIKKEVKVLQNRVP